MAKSTTKKSSPKKSAVKKSAGKRRATKTTTGKGSASKKTKSKAATKSKAKKSGSKWSARVTRTSNALDLEQHVFEQHDPAKIARSLKGSADKSTRKKTTPFQSAMSMLNFYVNRAGKNLPKKQVDVLQKAKDELRKLYGKEKQ